MMQEESRFYNRICALDGQMQCSVGLPSVSLTEYMNLSLLRSPPPQGGDSQTDIATAGDQPVALPDDVAEYSPDILAEFPSDMEFSYNDIEVYGIHMPVRHGSMRVLGFSIIVWNRLQPAWKLIEQDQYTVRCEHR